MRNIGSTRDENGRFVGTPTPNRNWHKDRFIYRAGHIEKHCSVCGKVFYMPPSKEKNNERCSKECGIRHKEIVRAEREKECLSCGKKFTPRPGQIKIGQGKYCSHKCHGAANYMEKSPTWNGGDIESWRRCSLKRRIAMRKYSAIPKKEISLLLQKQRGKCAVCKKDISKGFHKDHINPLAKGGEHVIKNIQLLCKKCNCRKKDLDPLSFMQKNGYLL